MVVDAVGCVSRSFAIQKLIIAQLFGMKGRETGLSPGPNSPPIYRGVPCGRIYGLPLATFVDNG
jgi:hypothetical protein